MPFNNCAKAVVNECKTNPNCSCTDPVLPPCDGIPDATTFTTTTTTSTTSTSSTSSTTIFGTTTSSTTTSTTAPIIQCCVPGSPGGAFTCELLTAEECTAAGGTNLGPGDCDPDPCAAPFCGNGIREPGEECDGGPACTPDCRQTIANCCAGPGQCVVAPGFSLALYVHWHCNGIPPGNTFVGRPGEVCQPDGSCSIEPMEPISVCCQRFAGGCEDTVVADTRQLWEFHNPCQLGGGLGITVPAATCAAGGNCAPL